MAQRAFLPELDDKIAQYAVACLVTGGSGEKLVRDAGYVQGLKAARDLFEEVARAYAHKDEEK